MAALLPTARGVAIDGAWHCYRRADDATGARCCYRWHAAMLPMARIFATDEPTMLPMYPTILRADATDILWRCYRQADDDTDCACHCYRRAGDATIAQNSYYEQTVFAS